MEIKKESANHFQRPGHFFKLHNNENHIHTIDSMAIFASRNFNFNFPDF